MPRAYVGVGSNLERERNLRSAIAELRGAFGPLSLSGVYESPAAGFDGPPFYNLVVGLDTQLDPRALNARLKDIEAVHGRAPEHRGFRSRTVDLDLLLYDDLALAEGALRLPAEDILRYAFVCVPLAELCPDYVHPSQGRPLAELCARLDGREGLRRVMLDLD